MLISDKITSLKNLKTGLADLNQKVLEMQKKKNERIKELKEML